jgi:hypothetical protein
MDLNTKVRKVLSGGDLTCVAWYESTKFECLMGKKHYNEMY